MVLLTLSPFCFFAYLEGFEGVAPHAVISSMRTLVVVIFQPGVQAFLQRIDRPVEFLPKRRGQEFVEYYRVLYG